MIKNISIAFDEPTAAGLVSHWINQSYPDKYEIDYPNKQEVIITAQNPNKNLILITDIYGWPSTVKNDIPRIERLYLDQGYNFKALVYTSIHFFHEPLSQNIILLRSLRTNTNEELIKILSNL